MRPLSDVAATGIVHGGHVYVFYLDTGSARRHTIRGMPTQGAGAGIAVARAPAVRAWRADAFRVWDSRRRWARALPHGLSAGRVSDFAVRGPKTAAILGRACASYSFAVAKLCGQRGLLGIESRARPRRASSVSP